MPKREKRARIDTGAHESTPARTKRVPLMPNPLNLKVRKSQDGYLQLDRSRLGGACCPGVMLSTGSASVSRSAGWLAPFDI